MQIELKELVEACFLERSAFERCCDPDSCEEWNACNVRYAMYLQEHGSQLGADALKVLNHFETCDWHDQSMEIINDSNQQGTAVVRLETHELSFDSVKTIIQTPADTDVDDFDLLAIEITQKDGLLVAHLVSSLVDFFIVSLKVSSTKR